MTASRFDRRPFSFYVAGMTRRTALATAGLGIALAALAAQLWHLSCNAAVLPPDDYVEYWAAGRLNLGGDDPYDPVGLLPLERDAGRDTDVAVMMWNPPWTLTLAMPLGALPTRLGQLVWFLMNLAAVGASAGLLWRVYGGRPDRVWIAVAVAFTFQPTFAALRSGQISPLLLLGAALFLWCESRGRPFAAGVAAGLLAIKPHLTYLFWPAVLLALPTRAGRRFVAGGLAGGLVAGLIPLAFNPAVYGQYVAAFRDHPPAEHVSLTLGTLLRYTFGTGRFALQFVPVLLGVAWFAWYQLRGHGGRNWPAALPWLLLVSFVTSPYGAWHFDLVLLLVPVVQRAAEFSTAGWQRHRLAVGVYVVAVAVMFWLNVAGVASVWFLWVAPLLLALYAATARPAAPAPTAVTPA